MMMLLLLLMLSLHVLLLPYRRVRDGDKSEYKTVYSHTVIVQDEQGLALSPAVQCCLSSHPAADPSAFSDCSSRPSTGHLLAWKTRRAGQRDGQCWVRGEEKELQDISIS